jgi:hypothetical protein
MTDKDTMPKEGYQYIEIKIPDGAGITLSGAMDDKSIKKIIDIAFSAEVDRSYTHLDPDDIVISRKELEGMKRGYKYNRGEKLQNLDDGFNAAIDKILEMGE